MTYGFDHALPPYQLPVLEAITTRFFTTPYVQVDPALEGMAVRDGVVVLGCRAGPSMALEFLLHEMSHMVEIDDSRAASYRWGLHLPQVEFQGRTFSEPNTNQASLRECRVFAFERNAADALGVEFNLQKAAEALQFMPDALYQPGKTDDEREAWVYRTVLVYARQPDFAFEVFEREWNRKLGIVEGLLRVAEAA